jgi:hypothetical protein
MVPDANGHLVGVFSGQINYDRHDFLTDADGNRLATVGRIQSEGKLDAAGRDPYTGYIHLDPGGLAPYLAGVSNETHFGYIANMADTLIQDDLIRRGIMPSPATT